MTNQQRGIPNTLYLSLVTVDPTLPMPLYRQIYQGVRKAIEGGQLASGTKLPSTRDLSLIWNVSRNTLRNAFDRLLAEGYLETIVGHGTFVADQVVKLTAIDREVVSRDRIRPISRIGKILEPYGHAAPKTFLSNSPFSVGMPDFNAFPHTIWNRIVNRCQRRFSQDSKQSLPINGLPKLREAIASYLVSARGLSCTPAQVDIVPGSSSGTYITAIALLNSGDKFWMEDPGYLNASGLLRFPGTQLVPVPIDSQGIDIDSALKLAPDARLAFVTPSHQYPLGITMSRQRRQQLLDWAASNSAWILEDDYDSEFRYDGPPIPALQGLDRDQRVIYSGTFSKVMLPSLRVSYIVLPPDLIDVYTGVKLSLSLFSPMLLQEALAEFMLEGHFVRHIRQMRKHYLVRRDALVVAFERHLAGVLTLGPIDGGLHAVAYLAEHLDEETVVRKGWEIGMAIQGISAETFNPNIPAGIVIGFANVTPEAIENHVAKLAKALKP